ncbi:MAG: hypothetical protein CK425_05870 [Parachlamydia sp.]|nr:MAG: hypothetical protein CK425_05870 [Parachlamydia sp.]
MAFTVEIKKNTPQQWNDDEVIKKLEGLKKANKQKVWVRKDLSLATSNWLTRIIWVIIGKRCLKWMFQIDLERSKLILGQIQKQLPASTNPLISDLFKTAVINFNLIAPRHKIVLKQSSGSGHDPIETMKGIDHEVLSAVEAETLLKKLPVGTYLLRQESAFTPLIISYKVSDGTVQHDEVSKEKLPYLKDYYALYAKHIRENKDKFIYPLIYKSDSSKNLSDPPIPTEDFTKFVQSRLQAGIAVNELFQQALQKQQIQAAAWLLSKGADPKLIDKATTLPKEMAAWLRHLSEKPPLIPANLDHYAVELGYGYKAANLMVLEELTKKISPEMKKCEVKVPPFFPISHFELNSLILKSGVNLDDLWKKFLNSFDYSKKNQFQKASSPTDAAAVHMQITLQGKEYLEEMQRKVEHFFKSNTYFTMQLEEWVKENKPEFVIVRSTGMEDSDKTTNPGGNASIPYVQPTPTEISTNIGKVLASYFSENSIMQRLAVGDQSLFTDPVFIPVLIQEMIGETTSPTAKVAPHEIFRSGVFFTEEPEKADGVTLLQVGLGTGEGIVSGTVNTDTYYIRKTTTKMPFHDRGNTAQKAKNANVEETVIHKVIRDKKTRQVGKQVAFKKFNIVTLKNENPALKTQCAVPDPIIRDIKTAADEISRHYGPGAQKTKAMDVEYTLKLPDPAKKDAKGTLYLLQARGLTHVEKKEKTYISGQKLQQIPLKDVIPTKTLLDGQAYVRTITSDEQLLFTTDLASARKEFLRQQAKVKAIIINESSSVTSHDGVMLRSLGVPVFVVEDSNVRNRLKKLAASSSAAAPLFFDPQRALVVSGQTPDIIKKGLISYSMPLELSVSNTPPPLFVPKKTNAVKSKEEKIKDIYQARLTRLNTLVPALIAKLSNQKPLLKLREAKTTENHTIRNLIDLMSSAPAKEAKVALATLLDVLYKKLHQSMDAVEANRAQVNQPLFVVFEHIVRLAKKEVMPALENSPPESPNRLFPIKLLEALIFQQVDSNVVGGASFARTLQEDKMDRKHIELAKKAGIKLDGKNTSHQLNFVAVKNYALSEKCANDWATFVQGLFTTGDLIFQNELSKSLAAFDQLNLTPLFLNVFFPQLWQTHHKNIQQVSKAIIELLKGTTLEWVKEKMEETETFEGQINGQWGTPDQIKKNLPSLAAFIETCGFNPRPPQKAVFADKFAAATPFGRLALLQLMARVVDVTDKTIKTISGNPDYPRDDKQKVKDFIVAVQSQVNISLTAFELLKPSEATDLLAVAQGKPLTLEAYKQKVLEGGDYRFGFHHTFQTIGFNPLKNNILTDKIVKWSAQLESPPEFNVAAITIGSRADLNFSAHWANTAEQYFTQAHQNAEKIRKYLLAKNGVTLDILDGLLENAARTISKKFSQEISEITVGSKTSLGFTIPVRQHSAALQLEMDMKHPDQGLILKVEMHGNNEHDRWEQGATFGAMLAHQGLYSFPGDKSPVIDYKKPVGVSFELHIPAQTSQLEMTTLFDQLYYMIVTVTMTERSTEKQKQFLKDLNTNCKIKFEKIDPNFFAHAFYLTPPLFEQFMNADKQLEAIQAAKFTLLGLAKQKMKDFTIDSTSSFTLKFPNTTNLVLQEISKQNWKQSLVKAAIAVLAIHLESKDNSEAIKAISDVCEDVDVKKHFPEVTKTLNKALAELKSPKDLFEMAWKENNLASCLITASKHSLEEELQRVREKIKEMNEKNEIDQLMKIALELRKNNHKLLAEGWIIDAIPKTAENQLKFKAFYAKDRSEYLKKLKTSYAEALELLPQDYEKNAKKILSTSRKVLVALSQRNDFQALSHSKQFRYLDEYLGQNKYKYIYDNQYHDTTKFRKAAPLYIIKGFESAVPATQELALTAFKKLIVDYQEAGKAGSEAESYLGVLLALSKGYYDTQGNKTTAKKDLKTFWGEDADEILKKLEKDPYLIF